MFKWFKDKFKKEDDNCPEEALWLSEKELEEEKQMAEAVNAYSIEELEMSGNYIEPINDEVEEATKEIIEEEQNINNIQKGLEELHEIEKEVEAADNIDSETNELIEDIISEETDCSENIEKTDEDIVEESNEGKKKPSMLKRLFEGLSKTRNEVSIKINTILGAYVKIDDEMLEDIEDILISADIGMQTTMTLIDNLRETIIREKINDPALVKSILKDEAKKLMNPELASEVSKESPTIVLVVGVNGVGKTTTIGKLAAKYKNNGKKVLIAAADTFRAAAIDQLKEWGNRSGVDVIHHTEGSDPAAVVFDGISAAKSRNSDILICDTAGRLHNKANLMKELEKINRILDREYPEAKRETLLVLDATTGQNAMNQAKIFKDACNITGIVLTKLDGTAKGGVVIALQSELQIPIKLIGVGEGIDDLQEFNIDSFLNAIFD